METHKIANLIIKYRKAALNEQEQRELDEWLGLSEENRRLFEQLTDESYLTKQCEIDVRAERRKIRQLYEMETGQPFPKVNTGLYRAAILFFLVTAGAFWLFRSSSANKNVPVASKTVRMPDSISNIKKFLSIGKKAALTLPDGSVVFLDSLRNGDSIIYKKNFLVKENDGKLKMLPVPENGWQNENENNEELGLQYCLLNIPRGRKYQLTLTDGSIVCLNAYSSLRFPMTFDSNNRYVELVGEGYFEIEPVLNGIKKVPFMVNGNGMKVNVVGTRFNVNAYDDEEEIKATLLEGKIEILDSNSVVRKMLPGQQARLSKKGELVIQSNSNVQNAIAWKNRNEFVFSNTPLKEIMRQVSRWYDVEVFIECCESNPYTFAFSRDKPFSELRQKMEEIGEFKFKSKGTGFIVMRNRE